CRGGGGGKGGGGGAGGGGRRREIADAERGERLHAEVGAEVGDGATGREGLRVAEGQRRAGRLKACKEGRLVSRRIGQEDLGGPAQERGRLHLRPLARVLARPELAGRDVDERHARRVATRGDRHQEVVPGPLQLRGFGHPAP